MITVCFVLFPVSTYASDSMTNDALKTLKKGIEYFHSISINGGYVYHYSLDMKDKWGEGRTSDTQIEVQPPGTPAVGLTFLRAYKVTGEKEYLFAAEHAGDALIYGQTKYGGWEHTMDFSKGPVGNVSFDDDQTQTAIRLLMALDQEIKKKTLSEAVKKGLDLMLASQHDNGAWPHRYPKSNSYHDFATFNDQGINDCLNVMFDAHKYYGKAEYLRSINLAGWFLILSQLAPPQPGWAQQYNEHLQPAWARAFEPPAVSPSVSLNNINSLIDLYLYTGSRKYLEPIPDAIRWIKETRLPNGLWARFVEIGTNRPLYYDRDRISVTSTADLSLERRTGYGYENDLSKGLEAVIKKFNEVKELGKEKYLVKINKPLSNVEKIEILKSIESEISKIISSQDEKGRWISKDKYRFRTPGKRWNGEYKVRDRISSGLFNRNINQLCDYIELAKSID